MLKTVKVVGLNSDAQAAQVLISETEPRLFLLLFVVCDDAFSRSRQALLEAEDIFYSTNDSIGDKINQTVTSIKASLSDVEQLDVLLSVLSTTDDKKVLYLIKHGASFLASLIRSSKKINLLENASDNELVSGFLQEGDRIVLTTNSLFELLGEEVQGLIEWPINNVGDEIEARLPQATVDPIATIVIEDEIEAAAKISEIRLDHSYSNSAVKQSGQIILQLIRSVVNSRRGALVVGVILLLVVLSGIVLSVKNQKQTKIKSDYVTHLKAAQESFTQAQNLKDLNPKEASQNLEKAKEAVKLALQIMPNEGEASNLQNQITSQESEILRIHKIQDLPIWLDLDLIKKNLTASWLSLSVGKILILDSTAKTLVQIDINNKSHQLLAGEDKLGQAKLASLNGGNAFVYSSDKGVVRLITLERSVTVTAGPDSDFGEIIDIYGFSSNIYLLDRSKNKIYKYIPVASGYSDKRNYFRENVVVNLGNVIRLQIDGSVWLMRSSGEILKYTQGVVDTFNIVGLDKPLSNAKNFHVSSDTQKLYVLDSGNGRLVVLDKKGAYLSQYQSDKFKDFTDLVVDEQGKKVYLLEGSKIYQMDLR